MSVVCGRGGTGYLNGVCEDANVGGFWSVFGLCGSGGLGVGPCVVLCPSCCDGTGGEGGLGAFCVGGQCWRCDATSASLAKWKRTSCASYWRRWIDRKDASPVPTLFLCLFWCCVWGCSRVGTSCCLRVILHWMANLSSCCLHVILHWMANLSGLPKRNRGQNASGFELLCVPSVVGPSRPGWPVAASSIAPPVGGGRVPLV